MATTEGPVRSQFAHQRKNRRQQRRKKRDWNHRRLIARITAPAFVILGIAALGLAGSTAAFASGNPVSVNATVTQSVTLTGLSSTITFPAGGPGTTQTANEAYAVDSNDPAGYSLTLTPGTTGLMDGTATIPNNAITVTDLIDGNSYSGWTHVLGSTPTSLNVSAGPADDTYAESWSLTIPGDTAAGSFSESFTYLALGN